MSALTSARQVWRHISRLERRPRRLDARWKSRTGFPRYQHAAASQSHLPRIVQPSMWELIIPPVVRQKTKEILRPDSHKRSNPASYFIWIYLFIGSQAIRILSVKNEHINFQRKADMQIEKLREVIRKLQAGEAVDVEKVLGTGIPEEEEAWAEALREIEGEERVWQTNKQREDRERQLREESKAREDAETRDASPVSNTFISLEQTQDKNELNAASSKSSATPPLNRPGFY